MKLGFLLVVSGQLFYWDEGGESLLSLYVAGKLNKNNKKESVHCDWVKILDNILRFL